jgi:ubiquinone/menaquinone biosynthesis C-methylase UbiE
MQAYSRFDDYVDLYDTYRLSYNVDVLRDVVKFITAIKKPIAIADMGSGTGILTRQLLKYNFDKYYAIEPNKLMQEFSIAKDKKNTITHINALSEKTTIPSSTIDVIFVGTAIHWFEPKKTLKEFKRILKKGGFLVMLSNGYSGQISEDLSVVHKKYQKQIPNSVTKDERYPKGMRYYSNKYYTTISRKNITVPLDQFIGLELSMSSAPKKSNKIYDKYIYDLTSIYKKYCKSGKLVRTNRTTALISNTLL